MGRLVPSVRSRAIEQVVGPSQKAKLFDRGVGRYDGRGHADVILGKHRLRDIQAVHRVEVRRRHGQDLHADFEPCEGIDKAESARDFGGDKTGQRNVGTGVERGPLPCCTIRGAARVFLDRRDDLWTGERGKEIRALQEIASAQDGVQGPLRCGLIARREDDFLEGTEPIPHILAANGIFRFLLDEIDAPPLRPVGLCRVAMPFRGVEAGVESRKSGHCLFFRKSRTQSCLGIEVSSFTSLAVALRSPFHETLPPSTTRIPGSFHTALAMAHT